MALPGHDDHHNGDDEDLPLRTPMIMAREGRIAGAGGNMKHVNRRKLWVWDEILLRRFHVGEPLEDMLNMHAWKSLPHCAVGCCEQTLEAVHVGP